MHTSIIVAILLSAITVCHGAWEYGVYQDASCTNNQVSYYYISNVDCMVGLGTCTSLGDTGYYYSSACTANLNIPIGFYRVNYNINNLECAADDEIWTVKNLNEPTYIVQYEFSTKKRSTMELLLTINITCSEIQTMTVNKCRFSVPCDPEEVYPYDTCTLYGSSSAIQTSCPAPVPVNIPVAAPVAEPVTAPVAEPQAAPVTAPIAAPKAAPVAAPAKKASSGSALAVTSAALLVGVLAF